MKRMLFLLMLLALVSCEKKSQLERGTYSCSIGSKTLFIEILAEPNCIIYFKGQSEDDGYYHIDGDEIVITGHATDKSGYSWKTYRFNYEHPGTIYNSESFGITADVDYGEDTKYCSFAKRY